MRVPNSSSSCSTSWLGSLSKSLPTLTIGFLNCKLELTTLDPPTYGINRRFSDPNNKHYAESLAFINSFNPHEHLVKQ